MSVEPTASAPARAEGLAAPEGPRPAGRAAARNTAIFSILTGLSRIAGLVREIVASSYFATSRRLQRVHDRLPAAQRRAVAVRRRRPERGLRARLHRAARAGARKEAFKLASTLFFLILTVLSAITVLFIAFAGVIMPLFVGSQLAAARRT